MVGRVVVRNKDRVREHRRVNERAILDATESLLHDRAYRDLAIEDVMATAGLTRTAFYRYFPDLESVLLRLVEDIGAELLAATMRWIEADPLEGRVALVEAGRGLAEVYRTHGGLLAGFADAAAFSPDVDSAWRGILGGFVDDNIKRFDELRSRGLSAIDHPDETARALVWMTERYLLETYGRGSTRPIDVAAETLADIWHRVVFTTAAES
jgi:TetR/AcrR family transcriptional regulator, ethionamide resistance regulator